MVNEGKGTSAVEGLFGKVYVFGNPAHKWCESKSELRKGGEGKWFECAGTNNLGIDPEIYKLMKQDL